MKRWLDMKGRLKAACRYGKAVQTTLCHILMISILLPPPGYWQPEAYAQSYSIGARKYTRGDIRGAEASLKLALRKTRSASEKAKIYKLLGITQYMQNKKAEAAASFRYGLKLNARLSISPKEVLDESVIPFFNAQKQSRASKARPAARAPRRQASAPPASAPRQAQSRSGPRFGKPVNNTAILISSNARNGTISIDGILAGNVGERIETNPGVVTVTLSAAGYRAKKFRLKVQPNHENKFVLNLSKPAPKRPKVVKRAPPPRMKSKVPDLFADEKGASAPDDVSGRDLMSEFQAEAAGYSVAPPMPRPAPAPAPAPAPMPAPAPPPPPPPPPAYHPPVYQAPVYQYPQPYYQQPQYAPAPVAPPPLPPPPVAEPPPPPPDYYASGPRPRRSKKSSSRRSSQPSLFWTFMPFGIGQYANGDVLLGALFTAGEAGALYFYFDSMKNRDKAIARAEEVVNSDAFTDEEKEQFIADTEKFVNAQKSNSNLALMLFGGLYGAGVIESYLTWSSKGTSKRGASLLPDRSDQLFTESNFTRDTLVVESSPAVRSVSLGLTPRITDDQRLDWGLGVKVRWDF